MTSVTLEDVSKRFGETVALSGLTLTVEDGEFLVLLGPSGCGKSTVLRLIAGLDDPSTGTVRIGGRNVGAISSNERDVAMVFQNYALYPHMTVRQNIEFPLVCHRVARSDRDRLTGEIVAMLGLEDMVERRPAQLSGGQRQRVALARALVRRPSVFLLDEPLSNLDASLRVQTREQLVDLHDRLGTTIVYVTHDQVEAMTMADRIAVIDDGRIQQIGEPQAVYDRPDSTFVARFIGGPPMNCMPGRLAVHAGPSGGSDVVIAELAGGSVAVADEVVGLTVAREGLAVTVGIRPEHLTRSIDGPIAATFAGAEFLGFERHLICNLADGTPMIVREERDDPLPAPGSILYFDVSPSDVHLFDAATGSRLVP